MERERKLLLDSVLFKQKEMVSEPQKTNKHASTWNFTGICLLSGTKRCAVNNGAVCGWRPRMLVGLSQLQKKRMLTVEDHWTWKNSQMLGVKPRAKVFPYSKMNHQILNGSSAFTTSKEAYFTIARNIMLICYVYSYDVWQPS